jgi:hypothetical protein
MLDFKDIFVEKCEEISPTAREEYELAFLLGEYSVQEIATELQISTVLVRDHMKRHIPLATREKLVDYLPSTAAQCAELLVQVKGKALSLLRSDSELEEIEARLLNTLINSTSKFLEKYGQVTEGISGINAPVVTVNYFELACKDVLALYPDVYKQIKTKMIELEKGIDFEVKE